MTQIDYPPSVGDEFELIFNEMERTSSFIIGQKYGNMPTLCSAIKESHVVIQFKKATQNEDYDVIIKKGGPALFKPPRANIFYKLEETEKLESHELIGKTAFFRISDKIVKDRMVNFIEIGLTANFFVNSKGKERLKFVFSINKIQPGLNLTNKNKDDVFNFGKEEESSSSIDAT